MTSLRTVIICIMVALIGFAAATVEAAENFYWVEAYYNMATPRDDIIKGMKSIPMDKRNILIKSHEDKKPTNYDNGVFSKYYFSKQYSSRFKKIFSKYGFNVNKITYFFSNHRNENLVSFYYDGYMILKDQYERINYILRINPKMIQDIIDL